MVAVPQSASKVIVLLKVESNESTAAFSTWSLTAEGLARIRTGSKMGTGRLVSQPRPGVELTDKTLWELTEALRDAGWSFSVVCSSSHQKKVVPYSVGSNKIWYCNGKGPNSKRYLICLLGAGSGSLADKAIPHFKGDSYYGDLLAGRDPAAQKGRKGNPKRQ